MRSWTTSGKRGYGNFDIVLDLFSSPVPIHGRRYYSAGSRVPDASSCCSTLRADWHTVGVVVAKLGALQADRAGAAAMVYVAVDDMDLTGMNSKLTSEHFVRTSDAVGLSDDKVAETIEKLRRQTAAARGPI